MNPWFLLAPMFLICAVGAYFSYDNSLRQGSWFWPVTILSGLGYGVIWAWAARLLNDPEKMFIYVLYWDILMMSAYYIVPLAFTGLKPPVGVILGAALVLGGILVIKVSS